MIGWICLVPLVVWLLWAAWFDLERTDNDMIAMAAIFGKVFGVIGSLAAIVAAAYFGGHLIGWW